jgi:hypothetical protein
MGLLSRIGAAGVGVPLMLSSLLLRALDALQRPGRGRRSASGRGAAPKNPPPDVKAMRRELTAVLDAHEGSREVFRYLAHLERQLAKRGLKTLDEMAVKRLRRALAQFEAIVTNWSSPNLAELRSRIAVAVSVRDSAGAMWAPAMTLSKAYEPRRMPMLTPDGRRIAAPRGSARRSTVDIASEVGMSAFNAALGAWQLSLGQTGALSAPASRQ